MDFDIAVFSGSEFVSAGDFELVESGRQKSRDGNDVVMNRLRRPLASALLPVWNDVPCISGVFVPSQQDRGGAHVFDLNIRHFIGLRHSGREGLRVTGIAFNAAVPDAHQLDLSQMQDKNVVAGYSSVIISFSVE